MSPTVQPAIEPLGVSRALSLRVALPCVLLLAAGLRLWRLGDAGFGTEYYAAAVRGMLSSAHNLLYNAFDPAGVLSVDKPPLALWAQVLSARLLGFDTFALMLPQAIEGCLAVLLVWHLVRRDFGEPAAVLAALFLAVTPVSVAVDRSNNTDSLLVLVLLLAVWALPRAGDRGAPWRLMPAMALIGVGFNVKMAAAFGVLPGCAASYAFTARVGWIRRLSQLAAGGAVLTVVSAAWIGIVALTPPSERPFIDSSVSNSIFDLAVNHNALQRFLPGAWRRVAAAGNPEGNPDATATGAGIAAAGTPGIVNEADQAPPRAPAARRQGALAPPPGVARLANPALARQALWLLPLAFAGAAAMILARRRDVAPVWIGWAAAYAVVFSCAGGLFSAYYLVMLGPPLAVLAAVGAVEIASPGHATPRLRRWWVAAVLVVGLTWQANILRPHAWDSTRGALLIAAAIGVLLALLACLPVFRRRHAMEFIAAPAIGVAALLIAPAACSLSTIALEGGRPLARLERAPDRFGRSVGVESDAVRALLPFLTQNRGGARFLAATANARLAAPLIIATGEPVVAFGGFLGSMPVSDGAALERLARSDALRFVILGDGGGSGWPRRGVARETDATQWVRSHGTRLDLAAIAPASGDARFALYDLRSLSVRSAVSSAVDGGDK